MDPCFLKSLPEVLCLLCSVALVVAVDGNSVRVLVKHIQELCSELDRLRRTECILKISKRKRKGHTESNHLVIMCQAYCS